MNRIMELRAERKTIHEEAKKLLDLATKEKRNLTAEEESKWTAMMADIDAKKKTIDQLERQAAIDVEMNASAGRVVPPGRLDDGAIAPEGQDFRSSADYRKAFFGVWRGGGQMSKITPNLQAALAPGVDTGGGILMPTETERNIIMRLREENIFRQLADVMEVTTDKEIPIEDDAGEAYTDDESDPESDITLKGRHLGAHRIRRLVKVAEIMLQDNGFNLEQYVNDRIAYSFGVKEESLFFTGDGHMQPTGVLQDADEGTVLASTSAITTPELLNFHYSLKPAYRKKGIYVFADSTVLAIRKIINSTTGELQWLPGLKEGEPDILLGRPVYSSEAMPIIATGAKVGLFFAPKFYRIADRMKRSVQLLREMYALDGQVGFFAREWVDGKLTVRESAKTLVMKKS
jgi:HK97 family phage major capsid protein